MRVVCLLAAAASGLPAIGGAADLTRSKAIECQVTDGRGSISFGRSRHLGEAAGTQRFAPWVFAQDGVNLQDRIGLYWTPSASRDTSLRVALDGPVSKPARLVSVTGDTVVAVAATSDQLTTRTWLITINFRHETVTAVATSSGAVAVRAQLIVLACTFSEATGAVIGKSAADGWRRSGPTSRGE